MRSLREMIKTVLKEETIIATNSGTSKDASSSQKKSAEDAVKRGETVRYVKKGSSINEEEIENNKNKLDLLLKDKIALNKKLKFLKNRNEELGDNSLSSEIEATNKALSDLNTIIGSINMSTR